MKSDKEIQKLMKSKTTINSWELYKLQLYADAAYNHMLIRGICPACRESVIVDGYVCGGCGYDPTYSVEEWEQMED